MSGVSIVCNKREKSFKDTSERRQFLVTSACAVENETWKLIEEK